MNNRLRNYALWVSIASFFMLTLQSSGIEIDIGKWTIILNKLLEIFILLGIINNPDTEHKWFSDDSKKNDKKDDDK